mgnify:CR=1 FL=1
MRRRPAPRPRDPPRGRPVGAVPLLNVEGEEDLLLRVLEAPHEARGRAVGEAAAEFRREAGGRGGNGGGGGRLGESSVIDSSEKVWGEVLQKNYQCCLDLTLYFLPTMQKREWGRIVTVTSIYGLMDGGRPWFNVAKVAQTTLMKNLAMKAEFASKNITFNSVAPGALMIPDTGWEEFQLNQPEQFKKMIETKHPQKRLGTAEEVASAITFICSYKASYLNGASILLDGGESGSI